MSSSQLLTFDDVAQFVRLHTHDVRNEINALDLESALLTELIPEGEAAETVRHMRKQLRHTATRLRDLSARFAEPSPQLANWTASEIFDNCHERAAQLGEAADLIEWTKDVADQPVSADLEGFTVAWLELLRNAVQFREANSPLQVRAHAAGEQVLFELFEPKKEPPDFSGWGTAPLRSTRRGAYGLGLYHAKRLFAAQGATLSRRYEAGQLIATIALPTLESLTAPSP